MRGNQAMLSGDDHRVRGEGLFLYALLRIGYYSRMEQLRR